MSESPLVWIHGGPDGWYLSRHGRDAVGEPSDRLSVCLESVRFVIDPAGRELARSLEGDARRRVSHAWAVGRRIAALTAGEGQSADLRYGLVMGFECAVRVRGRVRWASVAGARQARFEAQKGKLQARAVGPIWGAARLERVQEYGGEARR